MSQPMTSAQASELHLCSQCREEGDGACGLDCVLSRTCSIRCAECRESVFFTGNLGDQEPEFTCPSCGAVQTNRHLGRRWR
jgi:hypothetical protein